MALRGEAKWDKFRSHAFRIRVRNRAGNSYHKERLEIYLSSCTCKVENQREWCL